MPTLNGTRARTIMRMLVRGAHTVEDIAKEGNFHMMQVRSSMSQLVRDCKAEYDKNTGLYTATTIGRQWVQILNDNSNGYKVGGGRVPKDLFSHDRPKETGAPIDVTVARTVPTSVFDLGVKS